MSTYQDLVDTMRRIQERTGDPHAWMTGLTPDEVTAALGPLTPLPQVEAILTKIRQQHSELFSSPPPQAPVPSGRAEGDAAKAIADAEAALAQQNSATSQLDLQVISAILNAHLTTVAGGDVLNRLQQELETAVKTRSDLDTPAGARDFQRFLISKLRDIREVVATASLDDSSKAAMMAAWTSLYSASKNGSDAPPARTDRRGVSAPPPVARGGDQPPAPRGGSDPLLDSLLPDDPGLLADNPNEVGAVPAAAAPSMPTAAPTAPSAGAGASPGGAGMSGWGPSGGLPLPNLQGSGGGRDPRAALDDGLFADDPDRESDEAKNKRDHHDDDDESRDEEHREPPPGQPESPPAGPTSVTLPNGETVTAASPQLAAAIKAAAGGTPIAEAFAQQGMTIPPPGTAVVHPIDPLRVTPGDIGMFTDRHALALGRSQALLDGQIQHISTVAGPSFLGWQHPPTPAAQPSENAPPTDTPTPTRPATASAW
ncbi:MAG: hypothetical protein QOG19_821 [Mycobacterium sp.]|nr:hypothetical protein [Mycobacterium sp.]